MNTRLAPLLAILSSLFTLLAPPTSQAKEIGVFLLVDASDDIKTQVLVSIGRQLKEFGDVAITSQDFDYQISVVALVLSPCGDADMGGGSESDGQNLSDAEADGPDGPLYALSFVVARSPAGIRSNPKQYGAILGHNLQSNMDLEALCTWFATETNLHVFEPHRKAQK